ncbi:MAG TPA: hypothetical protein VLA87_10015 [Gaiellaceae bacterium]|nr:hypothetical protein [Gaiellaceae bacterium]
MATSAATATTLPLVPGIRPNQKDTHRDREKRKGNDPRERDRDARDCDSEAREGEFARTRGEGSSSCRGSENIAVFHPFHTSVLSFEAGVFPGLTDAKHENRRDTPAAPKQMFSSKVGG